MLDCFQKTSKHPAIPIILVEQSAFSRWLEKRSALEKRWIEQAGFKANSGEYCLVPNSKGELSKVLFGFNREIDFWQFGKLPFALPEHLYAIEGNLSPLQINLLTLAWGLGAYEFNLYKEGQRSPAKLLIPATYDLKNKELVLSSLYLVRDMINTPADHMGPAEIAKISTALAEEYHGHISQIQGSDLLVKGYQAIYAVGRASRRAPRLIDLRWGNKKDPKLTLVGKGVVFDTGGLDLKGPQNMALMKKDMGGAAHVLGLARMIMMANLPVRLRVLIPAVENSLSGDAYHPGDVIDMRNGKTVEVTNTDAEGRLILADALTEASQEKPELLVDIATLTGAARVALGNDLPALFSNDDEVAQELLAIAHQENDPMWQMPLYTPYLEQLKSQIADLKNAATKPAGGAINAALFLQEFLVEPVPWLHLDVLGWNMSSRPGRPEGGEAMGLRALFAYICQRFSACH